MVVVVVVEPDEELQLQLVVVAAAAAAIVAVDEDEFQKHSPYHFPSAVAVVPVALVAPFPSAPHVLHYPPFHVPAPDAFPHSAFPDDVAAVAAAGDPFQASSVGGPASALRHVEYPSHALETVAAAAAAVGDLPLALHQLDHLLGGGNLENYYYYYLYSPSGVAAAVAALLLPLPYDVAAAAHNPPLYGTHSPPASAA